MKKLMMSAVAVTAIIGSVNTVSANDGVNILNDIKVKGEIRPRYEFAAKQNSGKDSANAFTARTRLAVSGNLLGVDGLTAKVGMTSVNNFGYTDYNDGFTFPGGVKTPNNPKYDTIIDPQGAMVSEAYISYTKDKTTLLAGRSFINLDDQRFIGTVGWRQMERAYDTVTVVNQSINNLTLLGSYIYGYAGVTGITTTDTASGILHANYKVNKQLDVTAFAYLLANLHDTYGLRVTGKIPAGDTKVSYAASFAQQMDNSLKYGATATTKSIDAMYYDLAVTANMNGVILGAEYEVLGKAGNTSDADGFSTPLATLHKFQGFADEFLGQTNGKGNNKNGLIDMSAKIGYASKGFGKALIIAHKFDAETGANSDLGSELDALYANKIPGYNNLKGLLKVAYFSGGATGSGHENDNAKFWAQLDYKF
jgi:hypothetical protein